MSKNEYIHGVHPEEQDRLRLLNKLTNAAFIEFVQVAPGNRVLEIGSGLGIVAKMIAVQNAEVEVTGIEYSAAQIEHCDQTVSNLNFVQGDAHALPFPDAHFEVIYGRYILEHVQDPLQVLREAYRVLKPGGKVFFQENTISINRFYPVCPTFDFVWGQFVLLQQQLGGDAEIGMKLYSLLKQAGFGRCELAYAPEIHTYEQGSLVGWVDNLIGNVVGAIDRLIAMELATTEQINQAIQELEELKKREDASAYFYWNRAVGKK